MEQETLDLLIWLMLALAIIGPIVSLEPDDEAPPSDASVFGDEQEEKTNG
jgi:hypothetical protein